MPSGSFPSFEENLQEIPIPELGQPATPGKSNAEAILEGPASNNWKSVQPNCNPLPHLIKPLLIGIVVLAILLIGKSYLWTILNSDWHLVQLPEANNFPFENSSPTISLPDFKPVRPFQPEWNVPFQLPKHYTPSVIPPRKP